MASTVNPNRTLKTIQMGADGNLTGSEVHKLAYMYIVEELE